MTSVRSRSRRRNASPKGKNILTILIPGLKRPIDIEFPDGKLPVCQRCKKIYKTRELCRIRDGHNQIPWNTTYLCVSFDDSCLTHNSRGEICLVNEEMMQCRFEATLLDEPPLPFRAKKIHEDDLYSPICTPCKEKNYTRHHCREKQQHSQLPWVTYYIMLRRVDLRSGHYGIDQMGAGVSDQNMHGIPSDTAPSPQSIQHGISPGGWNQKDCSVSEGVKTPSTTSEKDFIDDIHRVPESRSCLLTVTNSSSTLRWLEIDPCVPRTEFRSIRSFSGIPSPMINPWNRHTMMEQIPRGPMELRHNMTGRGDHNPQMQLQQQLGGGVGIPGGGGTCEGVNGSIIPAISPPFTPVPKGAYSAREYTAGPGSQFEQQYHQNYQYYWPQSADYQGHGPPMHSQGPPGSLSIHDYPQDHFSAYQYQQIEHNRRLPYTNGYVPHQYPQESPNGMPRDYYSRFYSYNNGNAAYSQPPANTNPYANEQYSRASDQQESRGPSWSHAPVAKDADELQGPLTSMGQSPDDRGPPAYCQSTNGAAHNDGSEMSNQYSQPQEQDTMPREYYDKHNF